MHWKSLLNEAIDRARHGQPAEAIKLFDQVLRLHPGYDKAHYNRGCAHDELGDTDAAIADFSTALKVNPQYFNAYINRGNLYRQQGQFNHAIADFDCAIQLQPDS